MPRLPILSEKAVLRQRTPEGLDRLSWSVQRRQASSTAALEETLRKRLAFLERIAAPDDTANCIGYGLSFPFMPEDAASGSVQDVSDEWSVDQDSDIHEESLKAPSFDLHKK